MNFFSISKLFKIVRATIGSIEYRSGQRNYDIQY